MLFVQLMKEKGGNAKNTIRRRLEYQYPKGIKTIGEYWVQCSDVSVIGIYEADSVDAMLEMNIDWSDFFDISVFPAVTVEHGMDLAKKLFKS